MSKNLRLDALRQQTWTPLIKTTLAGVEVVTASREELAQAWAADCASSNNGHILPGRLVFDLNGHALSLRETDPRYRADLQKADVIHADGGFIVSASRLKGGRAIKGRSATTDMIHDFAKVAEKHRLSFYLLGGTEQINEAAAKKLRETYPGLRIVGRRNGYFSAEEEAAVITDIAGTAPDIVWVGLGKPKEQDFAVRNAASLNAKWIVTCGGCFNYITGAYKRAPQWMQESNLEWLHRVLTNPKLVQRYFTTTPHALWLMVSK